MPTDSVSTSGSDVDPVAEKTRLAGAQSVCAACLIVDRASPLLVPPSSRGWTS
jgi:hypothetical protein